MTNMNKFLIEENYAFREKIKNQNKNILFGWIKIIQDGKIVEENKHNMIVGFGREYVAQRLIGMNVGKNNSNLPRNLLNFRLSHFAVGSGGAVVNGQTASIIGEKITDNHLYQPISLGNESYYDEPSNYVSDDSSNSDIFSYINSVKPIPPGSIYIENIQYDNNDQYYTAIKCICNVPPGEPATLQPGHSVPISEAGLYLTNSTTEEVVMFSHVCFSPKWIELESNFTILWNIYC